MGNQLLRIQEAIHRGTDLLDDPDELRRLASLGLLTGSAAHDLSNSLFALLGYLRLAIAELPSEGNGRRFLERAQVSAEKSADIVEQLVVFQQACIPSETRADLVKVITGAGKLLETGLSEEGVTGRINWNIEPDRVFADMDSGAVRRAVLDIVALALRVVKREHADVSLNLHAEDAASGIESSGGALPPGRYAVFETHVAYRGHAGSASPRELPSVDMGRANAETLTRALEHTESLLRDLGGAILVRETESGELIIRMSVPVAEVSDGDGDNERISSVV